jgi:hypothetical protein
MGSIENDWVQHSPTFVFSRRASQIQRSSSPDFRYSLADGFYHFLSSSQVFLKSGGYLGCRNTFRNTPFGVCGSSWSLSQHPLWMCGQWDLSQHPLSGARVKTGPFATPLMGVRAESFRSTPFRECGPSETGPFAAPRLGCAGRAGAFRNTLYGCAGKPRPFATPLMGVRAEALSERPLSGVRTE